MTEPNKFRSGVLWAYLQTFAARGITTLTFLFVGLIISPAEFGTFALVASFLAIAEMICEQALSQTIVQLQLKDNPTLSLLFFSGIAIGLIVSLVFVALSFHINSLFSTPEIHLMILAASVCPLLISTTIVPIGIIRRNLDFKLLTKRTLLASGISSAVGLTLVYFGYGARGLVAQAILYYFIGAITLWLNCKWRPTTNVEFAGIRNISKLVFKNANGKLLDFIETRGIELLIGAFAGVYALGIYAFANKVIQTAFQILVSPIIEVIFSGAARGANEIEKTLKTGQIFISIIPVAGLLFIAIGSKPLLNLVYQNRWDDAVIPLIILTAAYTVRSYLYSYGIVLQATNHTGTAIILSACRVLICVMSSLLFLVVLETPIFVAAAYLISSIIIFPAQVYAAKQILGISTTELLKILRNTTAAVFLSTIPVFIYMSIIGNTNTYNLYFLLLAATSCLLFTAINLKLNKKIILSEFDSANNHRKGRLEKMVLNLFGNLH